MDKLLLNFKMDLNFKEFLKMVLEFQEKCFILDPIVNIKVDFLGKSLMAMEDSPFMVEEQYKENGIICNL